MFCSNCGTQIPDEAKFCWKCGKPQGADARVEGTRWEICVIDYSVSWGLFYSNKQFYFYATAMGPKGKYIAGKSPIVTEFEGIGDFENYLKKWGDNPYLKDALSSLIVDLTKDNWQPDGMGANWWSYKFRRPFY